MLRKVFSAGLVLAATGCKSPSLQHELKEVTHEQKPSAFDLKKEVLATKEMAFLVREQLTFQEYRKAAGWKQGTEEISAKEMRELTGQCLKNNYFRLASEKPLFAVERLTCNSRSESERKTYSVAVVLGSTVSGEEPVKLEFFVGLPSGTENSEETSILKLRLREDSAESVCSKVSFVHNSTFRTQADQLCAYKWDVPNGRLAPNETLIIQASALNVFRYEVIENKLENQPISANGGQFSLLMRNGASMNAQAIDTNIFEIKSSGRGVGTTIESATIYSLADGHQNGDIVSTKGSMVLKLKGINELVSSEPFPEYRSALQSDRLKCEFAASLVAAKAIKMGSRECIVRTNDFASSGGEVIGPEGFENQHRTGNRPNRGFLMSRTIDIYAVK